MCKAFYDDELSLEAKASLDFWIFKVKRKRPEPLPVQALKYFKLCR
jgi:hypothetical protein